jgi:hypothetical protein
MTTSTAIINTIIIKQIAYMAVKADIKINHGRKNIIYVGNLDTGQLNILAINNNRYLASSAEPLERYLIEN